MLRADIFVTELLDLIMCAHQHLPQARRNAHLHSAATDLWQTIQLCLHLLEQISRIRPKSLQNLRDDSFILLKQRCEQMLGLYLAVAQFLSDLLRTNDSFLRFFGEPVDIE